MEQRILSVFLPTLSIDLLKRDLSTRPTKNQDEILSRPIFFTELLHGNEIVVRCCEKARAAAIRPGMTLADAQALLPGALTVAFQQKAEQRALEQLCQWASRFSPLTAPESHHEVTPSSAHDPRRNGLVLDVTGCERLFHGESNLLNMVLRGLQHFGIRARIALTPSRGCSWAFSRYGMSATTILPHSKKELLQALAPLPVSALRLGRGVILALQEVNILTIGELFHIAASRPRVVLAERFGKEILDRMDQVLALKEEPIIPLRQRETFLVEQSFEPPLTNREVLKEAVSILLSRILADLEGEQRKAWKFLLWVQCAHHNPFSRHITLSVPSVNHKHLLGLFEPHLEKIPFVDGIEKLRIVSEHHEPFSPARLSYLPEIQEQQHLSRELGELLDRLRQQLGESRICVMKHHASHLPERSFSFAPLPPHPTLPERSTSFLRFFPPAERPSVLLPVPERIRAMAVVPDQPPFALHWRDIHYRVTSGVGPERIEEEWWNTHNPSRSTRDYFKVQIEAGAWLWVYRELQTQEWFLHGLWG